MHTGNKQSKLTEAKGIPRTKVKWDPNMTAVIQAWKGTGPYWTSTRIPRKTSRMMESKA